MSDSAWQLFDVAEIRKKLTGKPVEYREFFDVPAMHCGLYRLERGATDMQTPHDEDEIYYVVEGKAHLKVGDEIKSVGPGSVMYIGATEAHSFFEIEEDMLLLVFFSRARR